MRLVIVMAGVLATSALSSPGQRLRDHRESPSPTFGLPQDTFIAGCELYLFGRLVPPIEKNGKWGHWIRKDATEVCVNDVTLYDVTRPVREQPESTYAEAVWTHIALDNYFEKLVRHSTEHSEQGDTVWYLGQRVALDKDIVVCSTPDGKPVTVKFNPKSFLIRIPEHGGVVHRWREDPYLPMPPEIVNERALDGTYHNICGTIRSGELVLVDQPGSSQLLCARWESDAARALARAAIEKIPTIAKITRFEWDGRPVYDAVEIGDHFFDSSTVRTLVESVYGVTYYR